MTGEREAGVVRAETSLRLDWADFEPENDRQAMALALLTAGIVIEKDADGNELPGDLVRLDLETADIVLDALRSAGRNLFLTGPNDWGGGRPQPWGDEPDPVDELMDVLRVALQMNDLTLWSASGAHVFNSETALEGLARSLLARGVSVR